MTNKENKQKFRVGLHHRGAKSGEFTSIHKDVCNDKRGDLTLTHQLMGPRMCLWPGGVLLFAGVLYPPAVFTPEDGPYKIMACIKICA